MANIAALVAVMLNIGVVTCSIPASRPAQLSHPISYVVADMHDGDKKVLTYHGDYLYIKPYDNNQTWVVKTKVSKSGVAVVDFNVPGKPGVPPVNLTMTSYTLHWYSVEKIAWEFTDPSGTLAAPGYPLNTWIEVDPSHKAMEYANVRDIDAFDYVVADMHDGDEKRVTIHIQGHSVEIHPYNNTQVWEVDSVFKNSEAVIDFHVPGKPAYPPVNLTARFYDMLRIGSYDKQAIEFYDASGTIAPVGYPVNLWIELPKKP
eukprot:gene22810-27559_t